MENMNWDNLGFAYRRTATILRCIYKDGAWGEVESLTDDNISMSAFAGCLHYSIECFEGLKAFRGKDGKVRIFRPEENARRLQSSAASLFIPEPPVELFVSMCKRLVKENIDYLPPYGHNASLYIRPTLIGSNPQLGVKSSDEVTLYMLCSPVGAYVGGTLQPCNAVVARNHDRAAMYGTGRFKVGGNYAASLLSGEKGHEMGYSNIMYLDAAEHKYIEECGAANFFGIKEGKYITPKSPSVLPSITNMSLRQLAADMGLEVEQRHIPVEELSTFEECGACGTAAVISPIGNIYDMQTGESYDYGDKVGKNCLELYTRLQDIQYGRAEDKYGWCTVVL